MLDFTILNELIYLIGNIFYNIQLVLNTQTNEKLNIILTTYLTVEKFEITIYDRITSRNNVVIYSTNNRNYFSFSDAYHEVFTEENIKDFHFLNDSIVFF